MTLSVRHFLVGPVFSLAALSFPETSEAFIGYCTEPEPPYCLDAFGTFDDEWSFNRCKADMESYLSDVDHYTDCIIQEAREKASQAASEANEAIERFNCKAQGNSFCP